jgi:hypothetical protein
MPEACFENGHVPLEDENAPRREKNHQKVGVLARKPPPTITRSHRFNRKDMTPFSAAMSAEAQAASMV